MLFQELAAASLNISRSSKGCPDESLPFFFSANQFHALWFKAPATTSRSDVRITVATAATSVLSVSCVLPTAHACCWRRSACASSAMRTTVAVSETPAAADSHIHHPRSHRRQPRRSLAQMLMCRGSVGSFLRLKEPWTAAAFRHGWSAMSVHQGVKSSGPTCNKRSSYPYLTGLAPYRAMGYEAMSRGCNPAADAVEEQDLSSPFYWILIPPSLSEKKLYSLQSAGTLLVHVPGIHVLMIYLYIHKRVLARNCSLELVRSWRRSSTENLFAAMHSTERSTLLAMT